METKLCLADISTGQESGITTFDALHMFIGREPESGVCVLDEGISRRHGRFMRMGPVHWFYQDVGSTNGSYINGEEIEPGLWALVRENDIVQLADICLRVREVEADTHAPLHSNIRINRSCGQLLVLKGDELLEEVPARGNGKIFSLGGPESRYSVGNGNFPALVIEKQGDSLVAYGAQSDLRPRISGEFLEGKRELVDRAILTVAGYTVIYEASLGADNLGESEFGMNWIAENTKRSAPVRLVEVKAQRTATAHGMGKDLVPVGRNALVETENKSVGTTQIVTTKAIAIMAGTSTSTANRTESVGRSRGNPSLDHAVVMENVNRIKTEIYDTFSVISGVLSLFLIVGGLACLSLLVQGYSLKEVFF